MAERRSARVGARVSKGTATVINEAEGALQKQENKIAKPTSKTAVKRIASDSEETPFKVPKPAQTPKRRKKEPLITSDLPPSTPTPAAIAALSQGSTNPRRKPAGGVRKAATNITNAPLQTPEGTKVVKYPSDLFESALPSPNKAAEPGTTTENLLEKACAHLASVDPKLQAVIDKHRCKMFSPEGLQEVVEPFTALSSGIMAQQVSGAAASSIKNKFNSLFTLPPNTGDGAKHFPTPAQVVEKDIATLRTAGLSQRKAEYIHGLAEKFVSGELSAQMLVEATDDEVMERLIAVRGLGRWSVEMFACFGLKRTDIFSTGDLGVQRGIAAYVGKDIKKIKASKDKGKWKYMSEADMLKHSEKFSPYRSLFMWYMWRIEDVNLEAMES
ncbi:DNA-3-methyladenine glycosylase [Venturia nashicola]|nr:DNA-3-methyladenine glycosylase [Venturia nashicola]